MQIPYFKPPQIAFSEIEPHLSKIVDSRIYTKGEHMCALERELSDYIGVDYVIATGSGTAALWIALRTLRKYDSAHVAMPAFNWGSDKIAAEAAGYGTVTVDIDPDTWLSDDSHGFVDAHLALDTFGSVDTNDYPEGRTVYDATHSLGAKGVGSRGVAECFSMAATKMVPAGEGGFITTNDSYVAAKCTELRDLCSRIPEMSCVVARGYLSHLDETLAEKRKIADYYRRHLPYRFQQIPHNSTHSKICFLCDESEELILRAAKNDVECRKYYKPLVDLPHSKTVYDRIVCLPAWIGVDLKAVVNAIQQ